MGIVAIDLDTRTQRKLLRQIMEKRRLSIDFLAGEMKVPTEHLRRWLYNYRPETNEQRFDRETVHQAVVLYLATAEK
jgi:hypothetical protein